MMFQQRMKEIEDDVPPFGGQLYEEDEITYEEKLDPWSMIDQIDEDGFYLKH